MLQYAVPRVRHRSPVWQRSLGAQLRARRSMLTPLPSSPKIGVRQERHRKNSVTPRDGGDVRDGGWAGHVGMCVGGGER